MGEWTFFSNHGHVLVCLARDREARLRDVALQVGITERAVQKIVKDMQDAGYLEISKHGRRNRYRINNRKSLRHSLQSGCTVGQLVQLMNKQAGSRSATQEQVPPEKPQAISPKPEVNKSELTKPSAPAQVEPSDSKLPRQVEQVDPEPSRQVEQADPEPPRQVEQVDPEPSRQVEQADPEPPRQVEQVDPEPSRQVEQADPEPPRQVEQVDPEPPRQVEAAKPESREPDETSKKPSKADLEQGQLF